MQARDTIYKHNRGGKKEPGLAFKISKILENHFKQIREIHEVEKHTNRDLQTAVLADRTGRRGRSLLAWVGETEG
jgi:hypothetical protein